jgi:hypothetical protein
MIFHQHSSYSKHMTTGELDCLSSFGMLQGRFIEHVEDSSISTAANIIYLISLGCPHLHKPILIISTSSRVPKEQSRRRQIGPLHGEMAAFRCR